RELASFGAFLSPRARLPLSSRALATCYSPLATRHLPFALPDSEFGDPERGPPGMRSGVAEVDARRATPPDPRLARWGLAGCRQFDPSHPALATSKFRELNLVRAIKLFDALWIEIIDGMSSI